MKKILTGNDASAVVDTFGGELISYQKNGRNFIWTGEKEYWSGHAPVLFPNVGTLAQNKVNFEGKEYTIPKHGFARKSDFKEVDSGDDFIVYELKETETTLSMYPYRFILRITHRLLDNGFRTDYEVINADDKPITFCIGGHAGFCCPMETGASFEDYQLVFEQQEENPLYYTDASSIMHSEYQKNLLSGNVLSLKYEDYDNDALILDNVKSNQVKLIHRKNGSGISFSFSGFHALGIWTPPNKNAPFLCLEPWEGLPSVAGENGNFEDKPHAVKLLQGETFSAGYKLTLI